MEIVIIILSIFVLALLFSTSVLLGMCHDYEKTIKTLEEELENEIDIKEYEIR